MAVPLSFLRRRQAKMPKYFSRLYKPRVSTVGDMENFIKSTYGTMTQGDTLEEARSIRQAAPPRKKYRTGALESVSGYPRAPSMLTPGMKGRSTRFDPYDDTTPRDLYPDRLRERFPDLYESDNIVPAPKKKKSPIAPKSRNLLNPFDRSRRFMDA
tara:strand:+ start:1415 stop:1882 length:468 start_codon:yes stop_codon:yes gene_type:complete